MWLYGHQLTSGTEIADERTRTGKLAESQELKAESRRIQGVES